MRSYQVIVDGELITRPRTPSRWSKTRQHRPLTDSTIEAIACYTEQHETGSLNGTATPDDIRRFTTVRCDDIEVG